MAHAQQVLAGRQPHGVQRYALGPSLGQCCGGVVHLAYRVVGVQDLPSLQLRQARRLPVALFGAGHVGQALVAALQRLPCSIVWVDSRPVCGQTVRWPMPAPRWCIPTRCRLPWPTCRWQPGAH
jgi:xanthine dehydrogenase accessory factor